MTRIQASIQAATKQVVGELGVAKASVAAIMAVVGTRRQTFYAYYPDKYAAITAVTSADLQAAVVGCTDYVHWPKMVTHIVDTLAENRTFYAQLVGAEGSLPPTQNLQKQVMGLVESVLSQLAGYFGIAVPKAYGEFIEAVIPTALTAELARWLKDPEPRSAGMEAAFIITFLDGTIAGFQKTEPEFARVMS
ncbi:TetR/AcrR family transcriptional regulator C-terminal domain-containing protein [Lacticaseibacillus nasuensis]|uniref:TetR/AcrR family transcriptional regulator C-terminal domain-containing protein n=1 Tax=Lacticaseibacillus nasuensis TaxID=944671 RepID=UPI002246F68F|nr:TetR/AcrR family transcriptional regulator C-terminal domain-containing protein [Lacticaseibacillus nasuensis]MCX2456348.1 hypothetical protein [Lacticaseibacillus nasuensis]